MDGSLGYDYAPLVGRFKFHTPSTGATQLSFASEKYQIYGGDYSPYDYGYQFLVTSESTGYESEWGTERGSPTAQAEGSMTGSISIDLMPERDYFLWIWPRTNAYYRMAPGEIRVTVDGVYGTASSITASDGVFGHGIPVSLSFGIWGDVRILGQDIFSLYDNFICIFAYPLIALCTAIIVGWVWGKKNALDAISNHGKLGHRKVYDVWFFLVKFVCPILLLVVVITGLKGFFGF
jgi:hypothetical protein